MIIADESTLQAYAGTDYYDDWHFTGQDFTNWTEFILVIGTISLTEGSGLSIDRPNGIISPSIASSVTTLQRVGSTHFHLTARTDLGKLELLMHGEWDWLSL